MNKASFIRALAHLTGLTTADVINAADTDIDSMLGSTATPGDIIPGTDDTVFETFFTGGVTPPDANSIHGKLTAAMSTAGLTATLDPMLNLTAVETTLAGLPPVAPLPPPMPPPPPIPPGPPTAAPGTAHMPFPPPPPTVAMPPVIPTAPAAATRTWTFRGLLRSLWAWIWRGITAPFRFIRWLWARRWGKALLIVAILAAIFAIPTVRNTAMRWVSKPAVPPTVKSPPPAPNAITPVLPQATSTGVQAATPQVPPAPPVVAAPAPQPTNTATPLVADPAALPAPTVPVPIAPANTAPPAPPPTVIAQAPPVVAGTQSFVLICDEKGYALTKCRVKDPAPTDLNGCQQAPANVGISAQPFIVSCSDGRWYSTGNLRQSQLGYGAGLEVPLTLQPGTVPAQFK